ncbi:MAG: type II toxin-antitoxin system RelE/ParE family toxin [Bacteroidota bacterium]
MYQLVIRPRATNMAEKAYNWYEEQQPGLGKLFIAELIGCYDKLETWPAAYTIINRNYRQIILKTFPYVVVFEIIKQDVVVYAVFHTSRDPQKKFKK